MLKIVCDKADFSKLVIQCEKIINRNGCGACALNKVCTKKSKDGIILPIVDMTDINKAIANVRADE